MFREGIAVVVEGYYAQPDCSAIAAEILKCHCLPGRSRNRCVSSASRSLPQLGGKPIWRSLQPKGL